ncbi:hypothetical protein C4568_01105 [Candidatus Parcubacteria bacterium]|nr:MAG: hypothetical protein C4568_01105 [Candidatus Parcubacteria bacterium]
MRVTRLISRYFLLLAVFAFFFLGFLGLSHTSMAMGQDGQMNSGNCFMPGMTEALCQMNPLEHIASWQSMFTAVPSQSDIILLLLALLALALGALFLAHRSSAPPRAVPVLQQKLSLYFKQRIPIVLPLQEAFSNGILNPKIF